MTDPEATPKTAASPPAKPQLVLLVDTDPERQMARAASMRLLGATVDCAGSGAEASKLWQPHRYALVLIEFRGAGEDVHQFYERAKAQSLKQKFGFYTLKQPCITTRLSDAVLIGRTGGGSVARATSRIARGQANARAAAEAAPEPLPSPKTSFEEAVKRAERALSGQP